MVGRGDLTGLVQAQDHPVRVPEGGEVHAAGEDKGEEHAPAAAESAAQGDEQQGEAGQQ